MVYISQALCFGAVMQKSFDQFIVPYLKHSFTLTLLSVCYDQTDELIFSITQGFLGGDKTMARYLTIWALLSSAADFSCLLVFFGCCCVQAKPVELKRKFQACVYALFVDSWLSGSVDEYLVINQQQSWQYFTWFRTSVLALKTSCLMKSSCCDWWLWFYQVFVAHSFFY